MDIRTPEEVHTWCERLVGAIISRMLFSRAARGMMPHDQ